MRPSDRASSRSGTAGSSRTSRRGSCAAVTSNGRGVGSHRDRTHIAPGVAPATPPTREEVTAGRPTFSMPLVSDSPTTARVLIADDQPDVIEALRLLLKT